MYYLLTLERDAHSLNYRHQNAVCLGARALRRVLPEGPDYGMLPQLIHAPVLRFLPMAAGRAIMEKHNFQILLFERKALTF
jgi:hypothetical protein